MWLPKIIKTHPNCIPGGRDAKGTIWELVRYRVLSPTRFRAHGLGRPLFWVNRLDRTMFGSSDSGAQCLGPRNRAPIMWVNRLGRMLNPSTSMYGETVRHEWGNRIPNGVHAHNQCYTHSNYLCNPTLTILMTIISDRKLTSTTMSIHACDTSSDGQCDIWTRLYYIIVVD